MIPYDRTDILRPSSPMTRRSNLTSWRGSRRLHRNPFSPLNPVHSFRRNKRVNKVKYNPFITASHHSTLDMRDALSTPPPEQAETSERPQLGHLAQWSVSSHKYGFGVENLRDDNEMTFWQSEGPQPHMIDLSFPKRVFVSTVVVQMSHPRDDSYTPSKISIKAGTGVHDLQEVRFCEFAKPDGWISIPLRPMDTNDEGVEVEGPPVPCHHLRIQILANHLNGKDTHVRGLRIHGEAAQPPVPVSPISEASTPHRNNAGKRLLELGHDGLSEYTSREFRMHEFLR